MKTTSNTQHRRHGAKSGSEVWFDKKKPCLHVQKSVPVIMKLIRRCASFVSTVDKLSHMSKGQAKAAYKAFVERRFMLDVRRLIAKLKEFMLPKPKPCQCIMFAKAIVSGARASHA